MSLEGLRKAEIAEEAEKKFVLRKLYEVTQCKPSFQGVKRASTLLPNVQASSNQISDSNERSGKEAYVEALLKFATMKAAKQYSQEDRRQNRCFNVIEPAKDC